MVEMLGELIAGILGYIKKGKFEKAEEALEKVFYDFLKQDASFFRNIKKDELTDKLLNDHNYTGGHIEILAELFATDGELWHAKENNELSIESFEKAVLLMDYVDRESGAFSIERQKKIDDWKEKLSRLIS